MPWNLLQIWSWLFQVYVLCLQQIWSEQTTRNAIIQLTCIITQKLIDCHFHKVFLSDFRVDGVNLIGIIYLVKFQDSVEDIYLLPSYTGVALQIGDTLYITVFVNKIVEKHWELLLPFLLRQEENIRINSGPVVVGNLRNHSRASYYITQDIGETVEKGRCHTYHAYR